MEQLAPGPLLVCAAFDERGGLQKRVRMIAEQFARRRLTTVLTWHASPFVRIDALAPGLRLVRAPALAGWGRDRRRPVERANTAASVASGVAVAVGRRADWSSVYAAGLNPEGVVAVLASQLLARPSVIDTWNPGPLGNVGRLERSPLAPALKRVLARADAFVAGTDEVADELRAAGFPPARVHSMRQGIPLERFPVVTPEARGEARRRLGVDPAGIVAYCGRLDLRQKRLDLLVRAWSRARLDGWLLLVVGDGPDADSVRTLVRESAVPAVLQGWADDVWPWLAAADAFALPTEFEATGTAAIEGLACGLPGLVSRTPAFARLAPDGVVLVDNEVDAWAEALSRLATDEAGRVALGSAGRRWVARRYDLRRTIAGFAHLLGYRELAA